MTETTPAGNPRTLRVIVAVCAVALLVIAGGGGWLLRGGSGNSTPSTSSVDAGFARDMTIHHEQATTMAIYAWEHSTNNDVRLMAQTIFDAQRTEIGQFAGWLQAWGLNATDPSQASMAWMNHTLAPQELMPGLATPAQMQELQTSTGTKLDILFLQLMIYHHEGGAPMAQYAAAHAKEAYVRKLAQNEITMQGSEVIDMEQLLRSLGGTELPAPK